MFRGKSWFHTTFVFDREKIFHWAEYLIYIEYFKGLYSDVVHYTIVIECWTAVWKVVGLNPDWLHQWKSHSVGSKRTLSKIVGVRNYMHDPGHSCTRLNTECGNLQLLTKDSLSSKHQMYVILLFHDGFPFTNYICLNKSMQVSYIEEGTSAISTLHTAFKALKAVNKSVDNQNTRNAF